MPVGWIWVCSLGNGWRSGDAYSLGPQDAAEVRATMEGLSKAWKAALSGLRAIELCRDSVDTDTEARFKAAMEGLPAEVAKLQG